MANRPPAAQTPSQPPAAQAQSSLPAQTRVATATPTPSPMSPSAAPQAGAAAATATPAADRDAVAPTGPGRFAFAARAFTVSERKGMVPITIVRHDGSQGPVNVTWWTTPDSAKADDDYADFGYRTESFASGETQRVIYVPIVSDEVAEPSKSFTVHITNATNGAQLEAPTTATVTIVDDD
jgi:hypothetical protein